MRLKLVLLTTAVAFGLGTTAALAEDAPGAKSDITIVGTDTGNAPAGAPADQKSEDQGAANQGAIAPDPGDGGTAQQVPPAGDEGATGKSSEDTGAPPAKPGMKEGQLPSPSSAY